MGVRCNAQAAVRAGRGLTTALAKPGLVTLWPTNPYHARHARGEVLVVGREVRRLANDHSVDFSK